MITWIDLTNVHTNDKSTQTANKITMTEHQKINAELDRKTYMFSSFQLLDYDEGHITRRNRLLPRVHGVDSEGFSCMFEKENMRMVQLLGHLCNCSRYSGQRRSTGVILFNYTISL